MTTAVTTGDELVVRAATLAIDALRSIERVGGAGAEIARFALQQVDEISMRTPADDSPQAAAAATLRGMVRNEVAVVMAGHYTSKNPPPDLGKERFHREVRHVPGAKKTGRVWTVPIEAWRTYRAGGRAVPTDESDAAALARIAGKYRATR